MTGSQPARARFVFFRRFFIIPMLYVVSFLPESRAELRPDELVLIVNRNMPDGLKLAQLYAASRAVPDGRIIELDLPAAEQMSFDAYERNVVPAVRNVLRNGKIEHQVKCLVTFYGVPLRVDARSNSPADVTELKAIQFEQTRTLKQLGAAVDRLEALTKSYAPEFNPGAGQTIERLGQRADAALNTLKEKSAALTEPAQTRLDDEFRGALTPLVGTLQLPYKPPAGASSRPADVTQKKIEQRDAAQKLMHEIERLNEQRSDAEARTKLRQVVRDNLGLFALAKLLTAQADYFQTSVAASPVPQTTAAAFDSELSFLWIPTYARIGWQLNPFYYAAPPGPKPPVLMVMRLDAATPAVVRKMIEDSIRVEKTGLTGIAAVDARGLSADAPKSEPKPMVDYDAKTRDLAELLRAHGTLPLTFDDTPALIAQNSLKDIALYTGWYSVRNYVSPGTFAAGAVGYHTASFELVSLRTVNEPGWVRGLTNAGVVATVGPVAEPYLHAFPRPDDFFPLLMTGKQTLAEVYWKTTPLCSWMMCAIGDPLYKPFAAKPAMSVDDLPERLKAAARANN